MSGTVPPLHRYVYMVWLLIEQWIRLHGVVLSEAQGQLYLYLTRGFACECLALFIF